MNQTNIIIVDNKDVDATNVIIDENADLSLCGNLNDRKQLVVRDIIVYANVESTHIGKDGILYCKYNAFAIRDNLN